MMVNCTPSTPQREQTFGSFLLEDPFALRLPSPTTWFTSAQITVNCTLSTPPGERSSGLHQPGIVSFRHLLLPTACFILAQMTTSSMPSTHLVAGRPPVYPFG